MKRFLPIHRLSVQLLLGFVLLIGLTTLSAGVPAFWLTRAQLTRQAWAQADNAQRAAQSLLTAEEARLRDQLVLFSERPTLQSLARARADAVLQLYLRDFQRQSGLDMLLFCGAEDLLVAGDGRFTTCPPEEMQGFVVLNGRAAILAQRPVRDAATGAELGTAAVGAWLDAPFLQQLASATGAQHSLLRPDGARLASSFITAGGDARAPGLRRTLATNGSVYYATYAPLTSAAGESVLSVETALNVDDVVATERRAFFILAVSTGLVALLGSLLSVWFVRQVNAPLAKLTATAEKISRGDLAAPIPRVDHPVEIRTLAAALQRSQASMLDALRQSAEVGERLSTLLNALVEGVVIYDAHGRVTFWNAGAHHLLGWSAEEALNRHVNDLFPLAPPTDLRHGRDQFLDHIPPAGQKKQIGVLTRGGKALVLALTGAQLIPPGGSTAQVALVFRDVTEEEAAHRLRSYFLANISHEFRTPLSTLNASVELLLDERETFTPAEVRQVLKPMHVSLVSLQALIDNLLESSSIAAGQFTLRRRTFHIHEALENAVNIARPLLERRGQPFTLSEPSYLAEIEGDPARLTQALVNLIINASKYSPIGRPIELRLAQQAGMLWVGVADRGPGVPPEERGNLFRSFVRLDTGDQEQYGIGLGLYVVKTVVEAHGGRVGVSDQPGGGALFWFEIPIK
jgi:PAS domain S-box-containing protein